MGLLGNFGTSLTLLLAHLSLFRAHREHKVHNIVLYPDKESWCKTTPIKQVVTWPSCSSQELDNNVCVGACFSYMVPHSEPSVQGDLIRPYCDSCQPLDSIWHTVTLDCKDKDDNAITMQKKVQIITNCSCGSCMESSRIKPDLNSLLQSLELESVNMAGAHHHGSQQQQQQHHYHHGHQQQSAVASPPLLPSTSSSPVASTTTTSPSPPPSSSTQQSQEVSTSSSSSSSSQQQQQQSDGGDGGPSVPAPDSSAGAAEAPATTAPIPHEQQQSSSSSSSLASDSSSGGNQSNSNDHHHHHQHHHHHHQAPETPDLLLNPNLNVSAQQQQQQQQPVGAKQAHERFFQLFKQLNDPNVLGDDKLKKLAKLASLEKLEKLEKLATEYAGAKELLAKLSELLHKYSSQDEQASGVGEAGLQIEDDETGSSGDDDQDVLQLLPASSLASSSSPSTTTSTLAPPPPIPELIKDDDDEEVPSLQDQQLRVAASLLHRTGPHHSLVLDSDVKEKIDVESHYLQPALAGQEISYHDNVLHDKAKKQDF